MQNKQQYYERVKLLTETGKHLEAQALYEKLIGRKRIDSLIIVGMEVKHMGAIQAHLLGRLLFCKGRTTSG